MLVVKGRAVDPLLQVHAVVDVVQEHQQRPLVLLVAARRAEGEIRLAVLERHRRGQGAARARGGGAADRGSPPRTAGGGRGVGRGGWGGGGPAGTSSSSQNICMRVPRQ